VGVDAVRPGRAVNVTVLGTRSCAARRTCGGGADRPRRAAVARPGGPSSCVGDEHGGCGVGVADPMWPVTEDRPASVVIALPR